MTWLHDFLAPFKQTTTQNNRLPAIQSRKEVDDTTIPIKIEVPVWISVELCPIHQ